MNLHVTYLKRGKAIDQLLGKMMVYIEARPLQGRTIFPWLTVMKILPLVLSRGNHLESGVTN